MLTELVVCYTNNCRDIESAKQAVRWIAARPDSQVFHMSYAEGKKSGWANNRPPQNATWATGMPLVCMHNGYTSKSPALKNNRFGTLVEVRGIGNNHTDIKHGGYSMGSDERACIGVIIDGVARRLTSPESCVAVIKWKDDPESDVTEVPLDMFPGWFIRAFAITTHSSQGLNLGSDMYVGIMEFNKLKHRCPRGLYVALTRVVDSNQLWIADNDVGRKGIKSSYSVQSAVRRSLISDMRKNWPLAGLKRDEHKDSDLDSWVDINWFEDQWYEQDALCCRCGCLMHRDPQPHSADMSKRVTI